MKSNDRVSRSVEFTLPRGRRAACTLERSRLRQTDAGCRVVAGGRDRHEPNWTSRLDASGIYAHTFSYVASWKPYDRLKYQLFSDNFAGLFCESRQDRQI